VANITLDEAERVLQAAKKKAQEMGVKLSLSVVDARGDLICMVRMDGAPWRTPYVSRGKARASACFGIPSGDLTDRAMTPVLRAVMEVERGEFVPGQGALPIFKNGELIGAIGGSGGTAQEDEDASRAGVEAL
jgi:glc operon protein GlcG